MRRWVLVVALAMLPLPAGANACVPRVLVLSAFPGEVDPLLAAASVHGHTSVEGRSFAVGTLEGHQVAIGLTGIGMVNAERVTRAAIDAFGCGSGVRAVVFSGVSGGRTNIGDVTVPARWSGDRGVTWHATDPALLAIARTVIERGDVTLARATPAGDLPCAGTDPEAVSTVEVLTEPAFLVGGDGRSGDPFGGRALPCYPGGGDVFGCEPCRGHAHAAPDVERAVTGTVPFLDPGFFFGFFADPPATSGADADDMETAAAAAVAAGRDVPFIAFRALSDGGGDPLMLPGFPFQFFYYRQLAAENAARTTLAFLAGWR